MTIFYISHVKTCVFKETYNKYCRQQKTKKDTDVGIRDYTKMEKIVITTYRTILERIEKLENMRKETMPHAFYSNLKSVRDTKGKLRKEAEEYINSLALPLGEKEMAKNYYLQGKTWEMSFWGSSLCMKFSEKELEDEKNITRIVSRYKKRIERVIDEFM